MSTDDLMREQPPRRIEPEQAPRARRTEAAELAGTPDAVKQADGPPDGCGSAGSGARPGRGVGAPDRSARPR